METLRVNSAPLDDQKVTEETKDEMWKLDDSIKTHTYAGDTGTLALPVFSPFPSTMVWAAWLRHIVLAMLFCSVTVSKLLKLWATPSLALLKLIALRVLLQHREACYDTSF